MMSNILKKAERGKPRNAFKDEARKRRHVFDPGKEKPDGH